MEDHQNDRPVERVRSAALDALLGKKFPVLDDGFVRVVDYMGGEDAVVRAARVSYGAGTKTVREDAALLRYMLRNRHTSPFEHAELSLHVRVPMDTWRQWIRHRTAHVSEYSTRYSVAIDAAQRTAPDAWRAQSTANRQGSSGVLDAAAGAVLTAREAALHASARDVYEERLAAGVAREQARKDLPLSTMTEAFWKIDLHNLLHFLELRLNPHAQLEIRDYADLIGNQIVRAWVPNVWKAFEDYRLDAVTLSGPEAEVLRMVCTGYPRGAVALAVEMGWLTWRADRGTRRAKSGERVEFESKAARLGAEVPWDEYQEEP